MARSVTKDMTEGSPLKLIVGFFVPMLFGLLFHNLSPKPLKSKS